LLADLLKLLEVIFLKLFNLNPFEGKIVKGLNFSGALSLQSVFELSEVELEIFQLRRKAGSDFVFLLLYFVDLATVYFVKLIDVFDVVGLGQAPRIVIFQTFFEFMVFSL
jgi:hypothetical protein